jgi:hypothetical protein
LVNQIFGCLANSQIVFAQVGDCGLRNPLVGKKNLSDKSVKVFRIN